MTGRTTTMTRQHREPSQRAQATRSLRLAEQLRRDGRTDEYRAAIREHFDRIAAPAPALCTVKPDGCRVSGVYRGGVSETLPTPR